MCYRWIVCVHLLLAVIIPIYCQTFNKSDVTFVISRFRESLDNLCFLRDYKHIVYNRGDVASINPCGFHIVQRSENVGRESFVYLSHIIDNYENLPPAIVFMQGDVQDLKDRLSVFFNTGKVTMGAANDGFAFLHYKCASSRKSSHIQALVKRYGPDVKDLILHGHEKLLNVTIINPRYSGFGYFIVTKEAILRRPKSFYVELANRIGDRNDPYEGHFYERAWAEIFLSKCSMDRVKYYCTLIPKLVCH